MAFIGDNFVSDSGANTNAPRVFRYRNDADSIATIKGANYFDEASALAGYGLKDLDVIHVRGSDGASFITVSVTAGAATMELALDFA